MGKVSEEVPETKPAIEIKENAAPQNEAASKHKIHVRIIEQTSVQELSDAVETDMRDGWFLAGSMASCFDPTRETVLYQQMLVKDQRYK